MPRVTPEHAEARRHQILDAARRCFLRDGFHQTSMVDIQREANLSAGAIYLYFKGKDDIVLGIARGILGTIGELIPEAPVLDGRELSLPEIITRFLRRAEALNDERNVFPMALQVWAEAIRNPDVLQSLQTDMAGVKDRIRSLVEACQVHGIVARELDPAGLTMAMLGVAQGYIIQRTLFEETRLEEYAAGIEAMLENSARLEMGRRG